MKGYDPMLDGPPAPAPEQTKEEYLEQQADLDHSSGEPLSVHQACEVSSGQVFPFREAVDRLLSVMREPRRVGI